MSEKYKFVYGHYEKFPDMKGWSFYCDNSQKVFESANDQALARAWLEPQTHVEKVNAAALSLGDMGGLMARGFQAKIDCLEKDGAILINRNGSFSLIQGFVILKEEMKDEFEWPCEEIKQKKEYSNVWEGWHHKKHGFRPASNGFHGMAAASIMRELYEHEFDQDLYDDLKVPNGAMIKYEMAFVVKYGWLRATKSSVSKEYAIDIPNMERSTLNFIEGIVLDHMEKTGNLNFNFTVAMQSFNSEKDKYADELVTRVRWQDFRNSGDTFAEFVSSRLRGEHVHKLVAPSQSTLKRKRQ